ncbi:OsmC family protein [Microbacterium cremeum]|uniref:OsmC family protein n=1 Tax=Microbacterium cremeum TaxID=2782169 RepID=UPI001887B3B8|nr:OsmC family protein [Microbacterium cremeum]
MTIHTYTTTLAWEGSTGDGYRAYSRAHTAAAPPAAAELALSADAAFRGDAERANPEQLLVMAVSSCQLLSFLGEAARQGLDVRGYSDRADGVMDAAARPASISHITLRPEIVVAPGVDRAAVVAAAERAHEGCFIANSLRSTIRLVVTVVEA